MQLTVSCATFKGHCASIRSWDVHRGYSFPTSESWIEGLDGVQVLVRSFRLSCRISVTATLLPLHLYTSFLGVIVVFPTAYLVAHV